MTRLTGSIVLLAVSAWLSPALGAQQPEPGVTLLVERYLDAQNGLSLAGATAQALEREPSLKAVRAEVDVARGMRSQAGLRPNPMFAFERRDEPAGADNQTMASVEWPLDLFRRAPRIAVADRDVEAKERATDQRIRMLIADVEARYGEVAAAVRDLMVADNMAIAAREEFGLLRQRVEEGATPPLARDLMEVELRRLEADRIRAVGRADAALIELKRTLGMPPQTPLRLRDTLEVLAPSPLPVPPDAEVAANVAAQDPSSVAERSDVRVADAQLRLADARVEQARSEGRPEVNLFGSYTRMTSGFAQRGFDDRGSLVPIRGVFHYVAGGVSVTVPLRNGNQGATSAAMAERAGAAARLEAVELAAQAEVAAAAALETQARRALTLVQDSLRLARQNLDVLRQTYELGRATVIEVLTEQRRFLEAERTYTDTLKAAYDARTALRRARGER
jgi:cobalt-zinc-cadmium efflux system outer membrane protein